MVKALATKNVVAVLTAVALMVGISFAFAAPAKADTVSTLQAQVQALLAQIQALQGSTTTTTTSSSAGCYTFTQNLKLNSAGGQVMWVQQFLNNHGFTVAKTGAGSPGNETSHFGPATKAAVIAFQNAYASAILTPAGLTAGNGNWYAGTRAQANALCAGSTTTTGGGTTTTPTGPGLTVSAGSQPANSLAPVNATRVPFTTFTLANNTSAAVTVNGITVQRTGLANDNSFAGVVLLDSTGLQYGNSQTFNSNHQATIGGTFTLQAGQSVTYMVAGNMETTALGNAGNVASIAVVGVNTSVPVAGSLPITGALQTINESLAIGKATIALSGFDPNSKRTEPIGTTGLTFSGLRITTGSAEDQKLYSITWNQTGSAGSTDIANLKTVVNGTSYPVTVDASGKYYTSTFPGGILITKGNSADVYIQGDLTGSSASSRTVEFDIYRASDIYLVGQTYGFGIAPTFSGTNGTYAVGANNTSGFESVGNPLYWGSTMTVSAGQLSTVSSASNVAPQNIAINTPNQVLGGFSTNFTGEPVTINSLTVDVGSSTTGTDQLKNVTMVDSNGNVVAGPVDENIVTKQVVFNSSITFPVGPMTYTIKGTVGSAATNGGTYTLSTTPGSTEWPGAVGQISGSYVSFSGVGAVTMSTMTVQSGQLNVSASASPAATNVTSNQNNFVLANIVLDASQSGEDVRINSLPVVVNVVGGGVTPALLATNLTNCQLYNGTTVLNNQAIGSSQWSTAAAGVTGVEANFIFANSLTIPKGTTVTLSLQCNIGGGFAANNQFNAGVSGYQSSPPTYNYGPTVTGAVSGNTINPNMTTSASGTFTLGTATMTATVPTALSYSQVAGGTTGVTIGTFTLQPTSGSVNLQNIGLKLNSTFASSSDLANGVVSIWNGSTQIGTANFNGKPITSGYYYATSTVSGVSIAQNVQTTLTLKADLASIGNGQSGTSGHEIKVSLSDANGTSGNTQVDSGAGPLTSTGVAMFATTPTVALSTLPGTGVADGRLIAFSVTAGTKNPVGIAKLNFTITPGANVTVTNPQLYAYTDSAFSVAAGGTTNGLVSPGIDNGTIVAPGAATSTKMTAALEVPAGTTWYFLVKASSITYSGSNATWNVTTALNGDPTDLAPVMGYSTVVSGNFLWSPNSLTTSLVGGVGVGAADWTSGYGVSGLPSFGVSQTRSN